MEFERLPLNGAAILRPRRFQDDRGYFSETFRADTWAEVVGSAQFVQENHSRSRKRGTIRGLHFQRPPHAQGKLVRVTRGAAIDVLVDIRSGSATYGQHCAVELTEETGAQLWVPRGFLHGFCTLTDEVDFIYRVDAYYAPSAEGSVAFDDPDLGIQWPVTRDEAILAPKDAQAPLLRDIPAPFPKFDTAGGLHA